MPARREWDRVHFEQFVQWLAEWLGNGRPAAVMVNRGERNTLVYVEDDALTVHWGLADGKVRDVHIVSRHGTTISIQERFFRSAKWDGDMMLLVRSFAEPGVYVRIIRSRSSPRRIS